MKKYTMLMLAIITGSMHQPANAAETKKSAETKVKNEFSDKKGIPVVVLAPGRAQFEFKNKTVTFDFPGVTPSDTVKIISIDKHKEGHRVVGLVTIEKDEIPSQDFFDFMFDKNWKNPKLQWFSRTHKSE